MPTRQGAFAAAMHVVPVAMVQVIDFLTDVIVVREFFAARDDPTMHAFFFIGLMSIVSSVAISWVLLCLFPLMNGLATGLTVRSGAMLALLAPRAVPSSACASS